MQNTNTDDKNCYSPVWDWINKGEQIAECMVIVKGVKCKKDWEKTKKNPNGFDTFNNSHMLRHLREVHKLVDEKREIDGIVRNVLVSTNPFITGGATIGSTKTTKKNQAKKI